jgi:hypothetical protein
MGLKTYKKYIYKMEDMIINGINFRLLCEHQHMLARVCWNRTAKRKYEKQKEEKRRYKENHKNDVSI